MRSRTISKITSPFFVPLRRLIVWLDDKVGTCDHQLVLQPRPCFVTFDTDPAPQISELEKKVSKDKANLKGLGFVAQEDFRDTLSYAGAIEE